MKLLISKANKEDIFKIHSIEKSCFPNPWTIETFNNCFFERNTKIILAKDFINIVAFLIYRNFLDEIHIDNIAVLPKYRKNKIATKLINFAIKNSQNVNNIYLELSIKNILAHKLYTKLGFVKTRLRKNYYLNGDDAICMLCSLANYKGFNYD